MIEHRLLLNRLALNRHSNFRAITFIVLVLMHFGFNNLLSQTCSNPSSLVLQIPSIAYEVQGEAWLEFTPSDSAISVWTIPHNGTLPLELNLRDAACGKINFNSQPFYDSDDGMYRFRIFGLIPGKTYYLVFSGLSGNGFALDVVATAISSVGSSCSTTDPCGFIANPGFEQEDPNNPITAVPYALERYIDNACGWGIGSTHPGGATPDYYLAGLEPGLNSLWTTCNNPGTGNACTPQTAFGQGGCTPFCL